MAAHTIKDKTSAFAVLGTFRISVSFTGLFSSEPSGQKGEGPVGANKG
jgi:hypothetical protein